MVSHNGYFACRVCEFEGIYTHNDRTTTYPWITFEKTYPRFRTRDRFESHLEEAKRLKNIGNSM